MARTASEWEAPPKVPTDHFVSTLVYTDPELLDEERKKIFGQCWKFACHESEIPATGDYRTSNIAGVPIVILRGPDDSIRTFVNACPHRGAQLAAPPRGNTRNLTCFFHLWSFNAKGDCISITRPEGYEQAGINTRSCGLRTVRTAIRLGMIFVCLSDEAEEFDDYVGNMFDVLEVPMGTVPLEVFHYHEIVMNANWKQWHETNMELYHEWGHVVNRNTSIAAKGYHGRRWSIHKNGHGSLDPFQVEYDKYKGWEARDSLELPGLTPGEFRVVDLFPNTSIIIRATTIRIDTTTPIAPGVTLLEQRGLGVKGESTKDRRTRQTHHNQIWGPLGRNLPEDVFFVEAVERSCRYGGARYGILARHEGLLAQDDEIMRSYYRVWGERMGRAAHDPLATGRPVYEAPHASPVSHASDATESSHVRHG